MAPLDVVILQHNQSWLTKRLIGSIYETYPEARIILVDNGSSLDEFFDTSRILRLSDDVICTGENLPFSQAVNRGLERSTAEFVCIQNNDTVMGVPGYERMLSRFYDPLVGAVGPVTNGADTKQRAEKSVGVRETEMLAFFCCILRREALDGVGPLSTEFGIAYGEDDDYCIRLRKAGWLLLIDREVWVHHEHHATYRITLGEEGMEIEGQQGLAKLQELHG